MEKTYENGNSNSAATYVDVLHVKILLHIAATAAYYPEAGAAGNIHNDIFFEVTMNYVLCVPFLVNKESVFRRQCKEMMRPLVFPASLPVPTVVSVQAPPSHSPPLQLPLYLMHKFHVM